MNSADIYTSRNLGPDCCREFIPRSEGIFTGIYSIHVTNAMFVMKVE